MAILIYPVYIMQIRVFFFFFPNSNSLFRKVRNYENFCFQSKIFIFLPDVLKIKFSTNFRLRKFDTLWISIFRSQPSSHASPLATSIDLPRFELDRECVDLRVPIRCSHQWPRWIRVQKRGGEPHGCQWNAHKSCR